MAAYPRRLGLVEGIEGNRGKGWFLHMPEGMKHAEWLVPEDTPEATLLQILTVTRQGATFDEAVAWYEKSMVNRVNFGV
jgi:hypothetical protein